MSAYALERDHLPTSTQSAENKPLQPLENTIYFNRQRLVEFAGSLRTSTELQRAGWDSFAEIKRFISDVNLGLIKGLTLQQAVAFSTRILVEHIHFHDAEFTRQEPALPHHNYFGEWQGKKRVLGNNGRPAEQAVDPTERLGSPKRSAQKSEELLLQTGKKSVVVSMSAQGESGYVDENGKDIPHLNTYILVDWIDEDGHLKGATLVTDLNVAQAEQIMARLGAPANFLAKKGSGMQRVANLVENLTTPTLPAEYDNPLVFIFDQIVDVRGEGDIHLKQKSGPDQVWSVAEVRQKLVSYESILDSNATKDRLIREFEEFVLANYQSIELPSFHQAIIDMAEETVLLFTRYYRWHHQSNLSTGSPIILSQYNNRYYDDKEIVRLGDGIDRREFFAAEIAFLQSRAGCPNSVRNGSGRSSGTATFGESDSKGSLYFACPKCGTINKRPYEGYVEKCQGCGSSEVACKPSTVEEKQEETEDLPKAA